MTYLLFIEWSICPKGAGMTHGPSWKPADRNILHVVRVFRKFYLQTRGRRQQNKGGMCEWTGRRWQSELRECHGLKKDTTDLGFRTERAKAEAGDRYKHFLNLHTESGSPFWFEMISGYLNPNPPLQVLLWNGPDKYICIYSQIVHSPLLCFTVFHVRFN